MKELTDLLEQAESIVDPNRPPADLVLLINPAAEASTAKLMAEALQNNELIQLKDRTIDEAHPWIVAVSSKGEWLSNKSGDWYTDKLFPLGRFFTSTFKRFRKYPGETSHVTTVHVQFQAERASLPSDVVHRYRTLMGQEKVFLNTAPQLPGLMCNREVTTNITNEVNPIQGETSFLKIIEANMGPQFTNCNRHAFYTTDGTNTIMKIKRKESDFNRSSYWIFSVDPSIIPEHGDIFKPNLVALTAALFRISQPK